jgi:hypothetical protein
MKTDENTSITTSCLVVDKNYNHSLIINANAVIEMLKVFVYNTWAGNLPIDTQIVNEALELIASVEGRKNTMVYWEPVIYGKEE